MTNNWSDANNWSSVDFPDSTVMPFDVLIDSVVSYDLTAGGIDRIQMPPSGEIQFAAIAAPGFRTLTIFDRGAGGTAVLNNGLITMTSGRDRLILDAGGGEVVVDGTGTLTMGNGSRIQPAGTGDGLENGPSHTIRGAGVIDSRFINRGTITATDADVTLAIGSTNSVNRNTGTLSADLFAELSIFGGQLDNRGGRIAITDGGKCQMSLDHLLGGTLVGSFTGGGLMEGPMVFLPINGWNVSGQLGFRGEFNFTGIVRLGGTGPASFVAIRGSEEKPVVRLASTDFGALHLLKDSRSVIYDPDSRSTLELGEFVEIAGAGKVGMDSINFVNYGEIRAILRNQDLILDPREEFVNQGRLGSDNDGFGITLPLPGDSADGGRLVLFGGVYRSDSFRNGVIFAKGSISGGGVVFNGSPSDPCILRGVNLEASSRNMTSIFRSVVVDGETDGPVRLLGRFNEFSPNEGSFVLSNQSTTTFQGDFLNGGRVILESNAVLQVRGLETSFSKLPPTMHTVNTQFTSMEHPQLVLTDPTGSKILGEAPNRPFTNGVGHTIRGTGNIGANHMTFFNNGAVIADADTPLTIDVTDSPDEIFVNNGSLVAEGVGGIRIEAGQLAHLGIANVRAGSRIVRRGGDFTTNQGAVTRLRGGTITVEGGDVVIAEGGRLTGGGTVDGQSFGVGGFRMAGITNHGNIRLNSPDGANLTIAGDFTQSSSASLQFLPQRTGPPPVLRCQNAFIQGGLIHYSAIGTGEELPLGTKVTLIECSGARVGTFDDEAPFVLNPQNGTRAQIVYTPRTVELEIVAAPPGEVYDDWQADQGFASPAEGARGADPDNDGLTNEFERSFGLDPTVADGSSPIDVSVVDGFGGLELEIQFIRPAGDSLPSDITYTPEFSDNLGIWGNGLEIAVDEIEATREPLPFPDRERIRVRAFLPGNQAIPAVPRQVFSRVALEFDQD